MKKYMMITLGLVALGSMSALRSADPGKLTPEAKEELSKKLLKAAEDENMTAADMENLIKAGADVNYHVPGGNTPLIEALHHCFDSNDDSFVTQVVAKAQTLISSPGVDVNLAAGKDSKQPLIFAVRFCNKLEVIQKLLEKGADVNSLYKPKYPVLAELANRGKLAIVEEFVKTGKVTPEVMFQALRQAKIENKKDIAEYLTDKLMEMIKK